MIFTLAVHGAPYATFAHQRALRFATACLSSGHTINRIFFYHEAVSIALASRVTPQAETDITAQWQALSADNSVELAVCIASGLKRGVLSAAEAARYEKSQFTLADRFELVGLGQLIDAIGHGDRYLEFPA